MNIRHFPTLSSTSTYVAEHAPSLPSGTWVVTDCQTAGRGQRGNSWESEPGMNLTYTGLVRPQRWPARRQFLISEAVATAIASTLSRLCGIECMVKWPNDIYAFNPTSEKWGKICGILISHSLEDSDIRHTLIGAGINVNQTTFLSDAPNPVSVKNITGSHNELGPLLCAVITEIEARLERLWSDEQYPELLHAEYMKILWRGDARFYPWIDVATGENFSASIFAVEPLGHLVLATADGSLRRYAFKEVIFSEKF